MLAEKYQKGYFVTLYLAPGDYHHIHAPVSGEIVRSIHVAGLLWPVNDWSTSHIDNLFSVNERITSVIRSEVGVVSVVMVGATNVGAIRLTYDDALRGNACSRFSRSQLQVKTRDYDPSIPVSSGERIGTFHMGSTVILLFEEGAFRPGEGCTRTRVRYGTAIAE